MPRSRSVLDQAHQLRLVRDADIEVAVGGEDHAIDSALDEALGRHAVGELNARGAIGRTTSPEPLDGVFDGFLPIASSRRQRNTALPGVHDDADPILGAKRVGEHDHGLLHQWKALLIGHRAGDVEQEGQIARRNLFLVNGHRTKADEHEPVFGVPGSGADFGTDGDWSTAARCRIIELEIVDQLFDPYRISRRELALAEESPHVRVRRRVHVHGEGRERVLFDAVEATFPGSRAYEAVFGADLISALFRHLSA